MNISRAKSIITAWLHERPVIVFIGLFAFQILIFYCIYLPPYFQENVWAPLSAFYASLSGKLLNLMGQQTTVSGDAISSSLLSLKIKEGCDAVEPMALFVAGLFAFPTPLKKKLVMLPIGLSVIFVLNIVRIITLMMVGIKYPGLFDVMHIEVWQVIFILVAIAMWFLWLRWATGKTTVA